MRVGIDASNLRAGGGVTHLNQLLRAAKPGELGIDRIVVWGGRATLAQLPTAPWLTLSHLPVLDRALPHRLAWQRFALHHVAQQQCDLLFSPGGTYRGPFRPFVTMSRNLLPFQARERRRYGPSWMYVKLSLLRRGQAMTYRQASGVIFLNDYARRCVLDEIGALNGVTTVIPHGVDAVFRAEPREARDLASCSQADPFRLLYVSTVEPYKHQWHVVEAVARLRAEGLPLRLDLVGNAYPPAAARLADAMRQFDPGSTFVTYHRGVAHRELPAYYHRADAFVFASSCENMPNILLEAMAAGLPIACSDMGPMPAMLGDAGVYFDPTRPDSIIEAVGNLVRAQATREDLARRAFDRAMAYSWQTCANDTLAFLKAVHDRAACPRRHAGIDTLTGSLRSDPAPGVFGSFEGRDGTGAP